ncbi:MAG TPA: hypothetical protein VMA09_06040 [Candidatus Binataceae bacterium]|nr:hypothetical protein [Candidatus Binataceae bacterium]
MIDETNDVEGETLNMVGELVGGGVVNGTFHLRFLNAPDIKGRIGRSFARGGDLNWPFS